MKTETYLKTIERLQKIVQQRVSVIMCAERLPWRCHRRFIAQSLKQRNWEVIHIIEKHKTWEGKNY